MTGQLFPVPPAMSERVWQTTLQEGLKREGWAYQHVYRTKTAKGQWATSTTATGWPDLVALRGPHILAIECKAAKGRVGPHQVEWLARFHELDCGLAWLLSPLDDWQAVADWLHTPEAAPRRHGW